MSSIDADAASHRAGLLEICSHLRLDLTAESADPSLLPFMSPPQGAPPYYGFEVLNIEVDGFRMGVISDFFDDPTAAEGGDGFIVAPDGSRAGLVWKLDEPYAFRTVEDSENRWGVWLVGISEPLVDLASAQRVFARRRVGSSSALGRLESQLTDGSDGPDASYWPISTDDDRFDG